MDRISRQSYLQWIEKTDRIKWQIVLVSCIPIGVNKHLRVDTVLSTWTWFVSQ